MVMRTSYRSPQRSPAGVDCAAAPLEEGLRAPHSLLPTGEQKAQQASLIGRRERSRTLGKGGRLAPGARWSLVAADFPASTDFVSSAADSSALRTR